MVQRNTNRRQTQKGLDLMTLLVTLLVERGFSRKICILVPWLTFSRFLVRWNMTVVKSFIYNIRFRILQQKGVYYEQSFSLWRGLLPVAYEQTSKVFLAKNVTR